MPKLTFSVKIQPEDYLRYYQGTATMVQAISDDGLRIEFPASHLRGFVDHDGVEGRFEIEFDHNRRFIGLRRLDTNAS